MSRNAFVIVSLLVWSANARGEADESAKPVENAEDLPAAVGSRISVTGIAKNAKLWAVIDGNDFVINLADLEKRDALLPLCGTRLAGDGRTKGTEYWLPIPWAPVSIADRKVSRSQVAGQPSDHCLASA